jgi:hypothetical protein
LLSIPREISLETAGHEGRERGVVIGLLIDMKAVEEVEAHAVKDAAKVVADGKMHNRVRERFGNVRLGYRTQLLQRFE